MIIGEVFGYDKGNSDHFALRNSGAHVGLVVKILHDCIDEYKRCYNPSGIVEAQFSRYQHIVDHVLTDYPTVVRYSPTQALCTARVCNAFGPDQQLWYYDHHHLNTIGGAVVAHDLLHYLSMQPK